MLAFAPPAPLPYFSMVRGPVETAVPSSSGTWTSPFSSFAQQQQREPEETQPHILTHLPVEQQSTSAKLGFLVAALGSQFQPGSLGLVQVWTSRLGRKWSGVSRQHAHTTVLDTHINAFVVDNAKLQDFRDQSAQHGITGTGLGMLGKVWSTGALQVVQQVGIIPHSVHPRNKLSGGSLEAVAEVVYIPIFVKSAPDAGVQAVVEVVVSSCAREAMVVANLISFISNTLHDLRLSLYKPERLPRVAESSSGGRGTDAEGSDSEELPQEAPKRVMSRSGSTRLLSSFGELSVAEKVERPPKGPTRAAVEALGAAAAAAAAGRSTSAGAQPPAAARPMPDAGTHTP